MKLRRPRTRFALIALLPLCSLFTLVGIVHAGQTTGPAVRLSIDAPATVAAGTDTAVTVSVDGFARGLSISLIVDGSFGPRLYESHVTDGKAEFAIPGTELSRTGVTTLTASAGSSRTRGTLEITPRAPVEPVEPWVGSRSIVADGTSWSMAVAAPIDDLGNPVAEGTGVSVNTRRPDGRRENWSLDVSHLLAWTRILSGTLAGRTTVGMSAENAAGPDAVLDEVPGWPVAITLTTQQASPPADGLTLVTVHSDVMRDSFGNIVADGTAVSFVVHDPAGTERRLTGYTIGGVVEIPLQAPTQPGTVQVTATVGDVVSPELPIAFLPGPAIGSFPVTAFIDPTAVVVTLTAGPILGELNTFVPTGTVVTFTVSGAADGPHTFNSSTNGGYASITLRLSDLAAGSYNATATAGSGTGSTEFEVPTS